jgi:hypothetical protein
MAHTPGEQLKSFAFRKLKNKKVTYTELTQGSLTFFPGWPNPVVLGPLSYPDLDLSSFASKGNRGKSYFPPSCSRAAAVGETRGQGDLLVPKAIEKWVWLFYKTNRKERSNLRWDYLGGWVFYFSEGGKAPAGGVICETE